jgi:hypothetical protein
MLIISERAGRTQACNRGWCKNGYEKTLSLPVVRLIAKEQHQGRGFEKSKAVFTLLAICARSASTLLAPVRYGSQASDFCRSVFAIEGQLLFDLSI